MITYRMTFTASVQRQTFVNGRRTGYEAHLSNVPCTEVLPANPNNTLLTQLNLDTQAAISLSEVYLKGEIDVQPSDLLTTGGTTYRVQSVGQWPHRDTITVVVMSKEVSLA